MRKIIATIIVMATMMASVMAGTWTAQSLNNGQTKFIFKETFLGRVYIADAETKKEIPLTIDETSAIVKDVASMTNNLLNCEEFVKNNPQAVIDLQKDSQLNLRLAKQNLKAAMKDLTN